MYISVRSYTYMSTYIGNFITYIIIAYIIYNNTLDQYSFGLPNKWSYKK